MAEIVMPRLSDTMEEGTILRWLKRSGETVARGEELVEIETDKASMTYESDQSGVLEILAADGQTLAIGELIARVGPTDAGAAASPAEAGAPGHPSSHMATVASAAQRDAG
ncbi:MAG: lipoyl domain-containing protein, partial [Solirubrobacteraceae bacterium]